jgi:hypothetical protein
MLACTFKAVPGLADPSLANRRMGGRFQGQRNFTEA